MDQVGTGTRAKEREKAVNAAEWRPNFTCFIRMLLFCSSKCPGQPSELKIATLVDLYNNAERGFSYPNGIDIFFKIILITRY